MLNNFETPPNPFGEDRLPPELRPQRPRGDEQERERETAPGEITPWRYYGSCEHIVDGDTMDVRLDLGFQIERELRLRLIGIDTAEIHFVPRGGSAYQRGMEHKHFVEDWVRIADERTQDDEWPLIVQTHRSEKGKYGRYLADCFRRTPSGAWADETSLTEALLEDFGETVAY